MEKLTDFYVVIANDNLKIRKNLTNLK